MSVVLMGKYSMIKWLGWLLIIVMVLICFFPVSSDHSASVGRSVGTVGSCIGGGDCCCCCWGKPVVVALASCCCWGITSILMFGCSLDGVNEWRTGVYRCSSKASGSVRYEVKNINRKKVVSNVENQLIGHYNANEDNINYELGLHLGAGGQVGLLPVKNGWLGLTSSCGMVQGSVYVELLLVLS